MFYLVDLLRTSSLGDRLSGSFEGLLQRGKVESQDTQEILQQRLGSRNIKRLLLIKENQISQVKEVSAFLCMGRCKSLDSLKSFL